MAMFLQTVVFIQPLLPEKYRIALVCVTISDAFSKTISTAQQHSSHRLSDHSHQQHMLNEDQNFQTVQSTHQHDAGHECPYCTVFANLTTGLDFSFDEVLDRLFVRMLAFEYNFQHIYFALQRLYLLPQGRAPPLFA
ncbi:DUF2946 family protein [Acinetobacter bereziniae]|uniref:DUF2946 family protein n=1 Tax=Acinetobacter TaxID=469 RepID=UPI000C2BF45E|nr:MULTISPECIES: DUF2946 family protein [Acinetobacter]ATZ64890.1 DUF2946 domain-containing protein [Acinetobacter bereziniae]MBJ9371977.1 DUF2946 family protein [Acinetobacter sp. TGL-Y2]MCU4435813.1 DUF2946 domain-containing protein [Acinetobacter bereziniae]MCV2442477.1 DUF2946 domain-containing protein [Acinetobacter bereziniae]MDG3556316.1 DUF2946 family protein [Acinetobacter bereziniae]